MTSCLTRSGSWRDVVSAFNDMPVSEDIALILEALAYDVRNGKDKLKLKLPFEIKFEVKQEICNWQVKATTTLEYTEDWLQHLKDQRREMEKMWLEKSKVIDKED